MTSAILDHPDIVRVLFHPQSDYSLPKPGMFLVTLEVEPGITVGGRLYPASPQSPAIVYYHGNGEIAADYDYLADAYNRIDATLLVMDYRGYGTSTGSPTADNLLADATNIFNRIQAIFASYHLQPHHIYVMGRSLGSVPAIQIARHAYPKPDGLIIESGFSDTFGLLARMGIHVQQATEEENGFGNALKMEHITTPTLILHGQNDVLIPPSDGQELHERCAATDKRLVLIPGAGHNDIMVVGMVQYFDALRTFIHRLS